MKRVIALAVLMVATLSGSVATAEKEWQRWPAVQREKPVAVLLVVEADSGVPEYAAEYFFATLPALIANSGYYSLPPSFSYQLLRDSGYKEAGSVLSAPQGAMHQLTGADAVLYVKVQQWEAHTSIFATGSVRVAASYQLISTKSGSVIWHAESYQETDTTVDEGSWLEDMVLTDIETSSVDITELAQQLNESVLFTLPRGKYNPHYQYGQHN